MHENCKSLLFVDVETVARAEKHDELDLDWQKLWFKQCEQSYQSQLSAGTTEQDLWLRKAAIHPEFGQIVCVVMGFLSEAEGKVTMRVKPIFGKPEAEILTEVNSITAKFQRLCAYNGKKFDFPYIARRSLINNLTVPAILNTWGKKPWEIENIDPMELWQFGGHSFPSQDLLCKNFDIPVKTIMDGSQVHDTYYVAKDYKKIAQYCAGDVISLAKLFLRLTDGSTEINDVVLA